MTGGLVDEDAREDVENGEDYDPNEARILFHDQKYAVCRRMHCDMIDYLRMRSDA